MKRRRMTNTTPRNELGSQLSADLPITAADMFNRVLSSPMPDDLQIPFDDRVAWAWMKLTSTFRPDEQSRVRRSVSALIARDSLRDGLST